MILFESNPIKIGKHQWRMKIYTHSIYGNCTDYEWKDPYGIWRSMKQWPRYDLNDTYNGCPKSLSKLFYEHLDIVHRFIPEARIIQSEKKKTQKGEASCQMSIFPDGHCS